jgi:hypothetical protein
MRGKMSNQFIAIVTSLLIAQISLPAAHPSSIENTSIQQVGVPKTKWVGELQEKWQFPSDHLPIGVTLDGLHFASWNVLNSEFMGWVIKNTQGLSRSLIMKEHVYIDGTKLTLRDLHVIECIQSMLNHPTHPRSLLSLQECSHAFIEELQGQLPEEFGIVLTSKTPLKDQNIVIYNKQVLDFDPSQSQIQKNIFSIQPERPVMNLCFQHKEGSKQTFRIINAHLPGEPGNPAPQDFAAYVSSLAFSDAVTIAMGDMNFNEVEMGNAFRKETPPGMHFNCIAPYCTNIGLNLHSKSIDHFLILSDGDHEISSNSAEEMMIGLSETLHLLEPDFFICLDL